MNEESVITPGLQCCLICGRTLSDRVAHDSVEEVALAAIRAEHPEWSESPGACTPCVEQYRSLLRRRKERGEPPSGPTRRPLSLLSTFFRRRVEGGGRDGE